MNDAPFIALLGGMAVFCIIGALYFGLQMRSAKKETNIVLEKYIGIQSEVGWSDRLADRLDQMAWAKRLEPQLQRGSIRLRPSEYGALLLVAGAIIIFLFYQIIEMPFLISFLIGTSLTPFLSKMFINSRKFLYIQKIESQLSEVCRLLGSAARAGMSIPQGLELVVQETTGPVNQELGIVVRELQLGRSIEVSLHELLKRVPSRDLQVFVNALIIQRRAGGDLAKVLSEMGSTMEERKIIHKTIDATVAQARYSAYMLPLVSLLIVVMMSQMIDNFYDFFTNILGIIVLIIFVGLQVIGFLLIKKIADIKV
ncbi:type II secretion system F family protein [Hazenella sp. IB182353]|uniref:type II secretion system F family protein n=1 Tax=Polycladospora coralii TaxID=2771432 RepID=UPI001747CA98|nr:type II secretion system F family protein [Polycladospora coralii]MBS7531752.1 type II secretion system F family protein [Polycladospora coralii]